MLINNFTQDDVEKIIEYYSKCDCCNEHQVNRPTKLEIWYETHGNILHKDKECKCYCRNMSRHLCRTFKGSI